MRSFVACVSLLLLLVPSTALADGASTTFTTDASTASLVQAACSLEPSIDVHGTHVPLAVNVDDLACPSNDPSARTSLAIHVESNETDTATRTVTLEIDEASASAQELNDGLEQVRAELRRRVVTVVDSAASPNVAVHTMMKPRSVGLGITGGVIAVAGGVALVVTGVGALFALPICGLREGLFHRDGCDFGGVLAFMGGSAGVSGFGALLSWAGFSETPVPVQVAPQVSKDGGGASVLVRF